MKTWIITISLLFESPNETAKYRRIWCAVEIIKIKSVEGILEIL